SEDYPGQEGARHIQRLMAALRAQPPRQIGGLKVLAARDYQSGLRTQGGHSAPMGLPPSDVLYFELEGNGWVCVRPSGTEPKIKLYTGVCCRDGGTAAVRMSDELTQAARALLRAGA
ncbi:MAG: phospho-sugar mutase, partial [Clostridiales bacterium]|nr:phospho-sugar mutase [Clostridiales bacterium]